ncbi:S-layer homology domain-containing protein [Paenibacillus luteus]|uniref:S-layer homology domain-containing protein n=1 Tax=Paenibacillus luteus TaxID=2545753 RepID=UPI0011444A81|nr:S-layer homology domain-containing protein [Paenibacillus luteus]
MKSRYWTRKAMVCFIVFATFFGSIPSWISPESSYVQAAGGFAGGAGSVMDPYLISTADQLSEVRFYPNSYFELLNNIDLSNYGVGNSWEPIGNFATPFEGSLNGNNHTISNLYVNTDFSSVYLGLFGYMQGSGSVTNVVLENAHIKGDYEIGALVGYVSNGTFENITVTGSVYGEEDHVGGVIGYSENTKLTNVNADVYVEGFEYVGGLFGSVIDGTIRNSSSTGNVFGHQYIGGLVGALNQSLVSESHSHADVSNTDDDMGGLIGNSMKSHIEHSYATGDVTGEDDLGGLVGYSEETTIEYSYATGHVTGGDDVGGLVGDNEGGTISNSYATGDVIAEAYVGGLVGENESPATADSLIEFSYAKGSVSGISEIGGVVGYNYKGIVNNSYATGSITGENIVGGLVGDNLEGTVKYSYSIGLVTGDYNEGGLVGSNMDGSIVRSYYNTETSGQSDNLGEGLATQAMKIIDSYVDWDFDNVWQIDVHNNGYPYFKAYQPFITYVSNDSDLEGEVTSSNAYILNSPVVVIGNNKNWEMPGFIFNHWNTERDGSGISYNEGETISSNTSILLYAIWVENNEKLSGLRLSRGASLSPTFSEHVTSYTAYVENSVSSIKVTPDLVSSASIARVAINDKAAQIVQSGEESAELILNVGVNTINVVVTAADGTTTRTYTVTITRGNPQNVAAPSLSSNANMKQISLDIGVQLDGEFSPDKLNYTLNVNHSVHQVRITPTLANDKAMVELQVNGVTYVAKNGSESGELPLIVGSNVIEIIIKAENGTIKRYALTIVRNEEIAVDNKCLFKDIEHHWAKTDICEAASLGIVKGTSAQHFGANNAVTRAEFVVMLLRMLQVEQLEESAPISFLDQNSIPEWARPAMYTALKQGIIEGYNNGTLRPLDTINRAEMVAIIARVMNWTKGDIKVSAFSDDTDIPEWAKGYAQSALEHGIVTGRANNMFEPSGITTRAEAAVVILRLQKIL